MEKHYLTWLYVLVQLSYIDREGLVVYGIPKGGMIATAFLQKATVTWDVSKADIILDDLVDSGKTKLKHTTQFPDVEFFCLYDKQAEKDKRWIVFPWEKDHPSGEDTIQQNIVRQLQFIGEDSNREGLRDTPDRVVRSWRELFAGYSADPAGLFRSFDADGYDQIVLLKDIEMYSMCEHHILPFFGKAHVAYIPDGNVIGISKLARLVDCFARRLQIQERIGEQVTSMLMKYLKPQGAICIIEATHMCMRMRGCNKQNSTMVTSSLKGVFMTDSSARQELLQLIKGE